MAEDGTVCMTCCVLDLCILGDLICIEDLYTFGDYGTYVIW